MCAFTVFVSFQPPQPLANSSQTQPNSAASSENRVSRFKYFALDGTPFFMHPHPCAFNCTSQIAPPVTPYPPIQPTPALLPPKKTTQY